MASIKGTSATDILIGSIGDDMLEGLGGADLLLGGTGDDIYIVDNNGDQVYESSNSGRDTVRSNASYALPENVEDLVLTGAAGIEGFGNALNNVITGNLGNNELTGGIGNDHLIGGGGQDTAVYGGTLSDYSLGIFDGKLGVIDNFPTIGGNDGNDTFESIEQVQFSGGMLSITSAFAEFRVNNETLNDQSEPSITGLTDGGFVMSWSSNHQDGSGSGVYAQRYDANGLARGVEFLVNSETSSAQFAPSIAALADGGFVVSWNSSDQDSSRLGVYAQRYDASGLAQGAEFQVNSFTNDHQFETSITGLAGGGFVASWTSVGQDGPSRGVFAQRYNADGVAAGAEFQVNTFTTGDQFLAGVAALTDGGFVVTWTSFGQDGSRDGIYAQRYDANGLAQDAEFQVNSETFHDQFEPSVTGLADGGFVVSWQSVDQDGSGTGIYAQRYDANGLAQGAEFRVNSATVSDQDHSSITALADGGFVVAWESFNGGDGNVYAQRYDADGLAQGAEFRINGFTADDQFDSSITALVDGGFMVAWTSFGQDGSDTGIYAQRYAADGTVVAIQGDAGNNVLSFINGSARLEGGLGNDIYLIDSNDQVVESFGAGADTVNASVSFTLSANVEKLFLTGSSNIDGTGNSLANMIIGNSGNNVLNGGVGADTMAGGAGNDVYVVDDDFDRVSEGVNGGIDTVVTNFSHALGVNFENLQLVGVADIVGKGNALNNSISGSFGHDNLLGEAGNDTIDGSLGNDRLTGGLGNDQLIGGGGQDMAFYSGTLDGYSLGIFDGKLGVTDQNAANGNDGTDVFESIEQVRFSDATLSIASAFTQFRVSGISANGNGDTSIAVLTDGGFVVSWSSEQDGSSFGIYAQRYDTDGVAQGAEFQVNSETANSQQQPRIAALAEGGFVVSWTSDQQDGSGKGIYAQRYDTNGIAQDAEFRVNGETDNTQSEPSITTLADGGFVVSWTSQGGQDGSAHDVYAQRYDASGVAQGAEFQINTFTTGNQHSPSIAALADGSFVASWASDNQDGSFSGIYAQRYHANGVAQGAEFQVNSFTTGTQNNPATTALADGGFVVSWTSGGQDGSGSGIYAQRYDVDGQAQGTEFQVNSFTASGQSEPSIAALADGGFVVSWTSDQQDGSNLGIYAQRYNADGSAQGTEFRVNSVAAGFQQESSIAALDDGGFIVTWSSGGIYAQRYAADGTVVAIQGDAGNNTLSFINGSARLEGGLGNDIYLIDEGNEQVAENFGAGTDTVKSSASFTLSANVEHLTLTGSSNIDGTGNSLANTITGNSGNNVLNGGGGADQMIGGAGNDIYVVNLIGSGSGASKIVKLEDVITESAGAGTDTLELVGETADLVNPTTLTLAANLENLDASGTSDTKINLTGNTSNNTITGNDADNVLDGLAGVDRLIGGDGDDTYVVDNVADAITEHALEGIDLVKSLVSYTLGANQENLTLTGKAAINGTGNELANILIGNSGKNILSGGAGNDTYIVDNTIDVIKENALEGTDLIMSSITYTLGANLENLTLTGKAAITGTGNALNNALVGNDEANILDGGLGADAMAGGKGNDIYMVNDAGDTVNELAGQGADLVKSSIDYALSAEVENLELLGGGNIDGTGNALANALKGNQGNNVLNGGAGQDTAVYSGAQAGYSIELINGKLSIVDIDFSNGNDGIDTLEDIEKVQFSDGTISATLPPVFTEFQVNSFTTGTQNNPAMTALADGGFVVTWVSTGQDSSGNGVYAQRYDADGVAQGTEFRVNSETSNNQFEPSVTTLAGGGFVVSWSSAAQDGDDAGVYAQRYDANGVAQGAEFRVNTFVNNDQFESSITALADGGFLVSWESADQDAPGFSVYAQRYDANGATQGAEFRINTFTANDQFQPSITALADGGFVASWTSAGQDGSSLGVYARRYDADGLAQGAEFRVNTTTANNQFEPSIAALAGGGFVVSWQSHELNGVNFDIYAQRYDADGLAQGAEFRVNTFTAIDQFEPSVTGLADGGFVVTWTSTPDQDGSAFGIFAQRYDADGAAMGEEFQVNTFATAGQSQPSITALTDGGYVVSWTSNGADGSGLGVFAQRYGADGTDITVIQGDAGNNSLSFINGSARLEGGFGNDSYFVDDAGDEVVEASNAGTDTVISSIDFTLSSNVENLSLVGSAHLNATGNGLANSITGNGGNNVLDGGTGADKLAGGAGNDTYILDQTDAIAEAKNGGIDTVMANFSYTLGANVENLQLMGAGSVNGTGNTLANILTGNNGDNKLSGDAGNDVINGGFGTDILTGGTGQDMFVFSTALSGSNVDLVKDFKVVDDSISLDNDIFAALGIGALDVTMFTKGAAAFDANDHIIYNAGTGQLFYDADGNGAGAAQQFALLSTGLGLTAADFSIID